MEGEKGDVFPDAFPVEAGTKTLYNMKEREKMEKAGGNGMKAMRQKARQVTDRGIICAMLDQMEIIHVGMHDEPAPYVVKMTWCSISTAPGRGISLSCLKGIPASA